MEDILRSANDLPRRPAVGPREMRITAGVDVQFAQPLERRIGFPQSGKLSFGVVVVAAVLIPFLQRTFSRAHDMPDDIAVCDDIAEDPHAGFDIDLVYDLVDAPKDATGEYELTHDFSPCTR